MAERRGKLHIDTLRVRVPGRDAAAGRAAALDLVQGLAARSPELLAGAPGGATVGGLKVRIPAGRAGERHARAGAVASALSRAVTRAGRGS